MQNLSIFSDGLFLIDLILLGLAAWFFIQAKADIARSRMPIYQAKKFPLIVICIVVWIVSIIVRAADI